MLETLCQNLNEVRNALTAACEEVGRSVDEVTLVCVTKYAEIDWVRGLYELGERHFGESRPQQLAERAELLPIDVHWHLIGSLQANKVRLTIQHAQTIHSVDSAKLLERVKRIAAEEQRAVDLFLQVNVSHEQTKHGWTPDGFREEAGRLVGGDFAPIAGLMTMAPPVESASEAAPFFRTLRELRDDVLPNAASLSMGMSGDFAEAIREGATHIRVGSRLFKGLAREL